ncbi:hypothetical protein SAMN06265784_11871 [Paraburkholderia susongensis]|uniref:Uncharacterized protein n=1 Tax=Paraburkholderia susongensis TaxID=1515439 RepID=A0A1X7M697_9BURK|nr:hypothetical protein SAMN06265784_11871 [Paraburkholderia susongensis]
MGKRSAFRRSLPRVPLKSAADLQQGVRRTSEVRIIAFTL